MTGLEATRAIRQREAKSGKHHIIIGLSGHAAEEDEIRFREAGMDAVLAKPVHMDKLYWVVESTAQSMQKSATRASAKTEPLAPPRAPSASQFSDPMPTVAANAATRFRRCSHAPPPHHRRKRKADSLSRENFPGGRAKDACTHPQRHRQKRSHQAGQLRASAERLHRNFWRAQSRRRRAQPRSFGSRTQSGRRRERPACPRIRVHDPPARASRDPIRAGTRRPAKSAPRARAAMRASAANSPPERLVRLTFAFCSPTLDLA